MLGYSYTQSYMAIHGQRYPIHFSPYLQRLSSAFVLLGKVVMHPVFVLCVASDDWSNIGFQTQFAVLSHFVNPRLHLIKCDVLLYSVLPTKPHSDWVKYHSSSPQHLRSFRTNDNLHTYLYRVKHSTYCASASSLPRLTPPGASVLCNCKRNLGISSTCHNNCFSNHVSFRPNRIRHRTLVVHRQW